MNARKQVIVSMGAGLVFSVIGYLGLSIVDGVRNIFPSPFQYLVLTYVLPHLGIRENALGTAEGCLWLLVVPWLAWTLLLFLLLQTWSHFTKSEKRAA